MCQKYMYNHVQYAATTNQLVAWHQYTLTCGHTKVAEVLELLTYQHILENTFAVWETSLKGFFCSLFVLFRNVGTSLNGICNS